MRLNEQTIINYTNLFSLKGFVMVMLSIQNFRSKAATFEVSFQRRGLHILGSVNSCCCHMKLK
jgi:hypothetical protein